MGRLEVKKLTDDQILKLFSGFVYQDQIIKIVRLVEMYYGIGEKQCASNNSKQK